MRLISRQCIINWFLQPCKACVYGCINTDFMNPVWSVRKPSLICIQLILSETRCVTPCYLNSLTEWRFLHPWQNLSSTSQASNNAWNSVNEPCFFTVTPLNPCWNSTALKFSSCISDPKSMLCKVVGISFTTCNRKHLWGTETVILPIN